MSEFVHLHVHSQFSMLDSALRLKALVKSAKQFNMPAVALTDHGNMFGAVQLVSECNKQGVKPILGCEVNLCADRRSGRDAQHLVLLCNSQEGYKNLIRLTSLGWVEGYAVGKPRIDLEQVYAHRKGLVGLSACMGGYLAQEVLQKGEDAGRAALAKLRDAFEPGQFFVELQDHGFVEQKPLSEILVSLANEFSLPLVASNDCHYSERKNAHAQMVLQCIAGGTMVADMERVHHRSEELYFKSGEEMAELFRHLPEAISNTLRVAEMCGGQASPFAKPMLPSFQVPEGSDEVTHFHALARKGLEERFGEFRAIEKHVDEAGYRGRLAMECDVIAQMGFSGYFLIVQDFINWAKQRGIPVGPGRGSGAGSIVAYAMRITDLDPIPYGLLFERFLNPERVSMPDFDIDFCMDRRDEVIDYVRGKYGKTSVGQIATFHLLKSRSVVRDVGRVMGMSPSDAGRIATLVPEPVQGKSVPVAEALKQEKRLKDAYDQDANVKQLLDTAMDLEELNRHAGMHAAGVVISEGPLWDHVPVFCPEPDVYVTQYDKNDVEYAGLVKFDFLGLKTLTTIDIATRLINRRPDRDNNPFLLERIPMDDATTYALLSSGETTNVFQLESTGMQTLIKQLRPDNFDDIVALVALYRPGPLGSGMVDDYVAGKHGKKKVEYPHACLEASLKETHGVMVYQEQVMQAARVMAGYSLGGADLLRRAMGKKKPEEMAKQKVTFVDGAKANGHSAEDAERVFELMNFFSGYGFNKSHSAAYALISYQCAYMKAHFPVEFLCATMTADRDKIEKVVRTVAEARAMGITVLAPDVNESQIDFSCVYDLNFEAPKRRPNQPICVGGKLRDPLNPKIRFGLGAVKGVGAAALESILERRSAIGDAGKPEPFLDVFDFTSRVDLRRVNKGVVESLVQCGAMDTLHDPRQIARDRALAAIESAIEIGKKASADRESGQTDLFGMFMGDGDAAGDGNGNGKSSLNIGRRFTFPEVPEPWSRNEKLKREKATLGFYVSGHPLDTYREELKRFCNGNTASISNVSEGTTVMLGGMVEDYRERNTKSGGKMAFFFLDDPYGRIEVIVRQRAVEQFRELLSGDQPLLITGNVRADREGGGGGGGGGGGDDSGDQPAEVKLLLDDATLLVQALRARTRAVRVKVHVDQCDKRKLVELKRALEAHPGRCPVVVQLVSTEWRVSLGNGKLMVEPSEAMLGSLERLFGEKVAELR
ncbi:MAG TPA: DNA polymerase III subunit alpha [Polyangiales bacterium]|nr:DNA polymerase III subunit alpha [Polyangiales bacterium]